MDIRTETKAVEVTTVEEREVVTLTLLPSEAKLLYRLAVGHLAGISAEAAQARLDNNWVYKLEELA